MKSNKKVITKLEARLRTALSAATIQAQGLPDFDFFSYQADWSNFPNSLVVNCHLHRQTSKGDIESTLSKILQSCLLKQGIKFRDFRNNILVTTTPKQSNNQPQPPKQ